VRERREAERRQRKEEGKEKRKKGKRKIEKKKKGEREKDIVAAGFAVATATERARAPVGRDAQNEEE